MGEESRGGKSRSRVPCVIKSREMDPKLGQEGGLPEIAHFPIFYSVGLFLMIISYRPLDNLPLIAVCMLSDLETITRSNIALDIRARKKNIVAQDDKKRTMRFSGGKFGALLGGSIIQ